MRIDLYSLLIASSFWRQTRDKIIDELYTLQRYKHLFSDYRIKVETGTTSVLALYSRTKI